MKLPNIVFVFSDQWRYQAVGYTGNQDVFTPNIDAFAQECCNVTQAVSPCPVCSPYRASLITGQLPLTHGVIVNDVPVKTSSPGFGNIFKKLGYETGYIGKWHINGQGRQAPIPKERRFGFDYWKVLECGHSYRNSAYYHNDDTDLSYWDGYDAYAQTEDAVSFMHRRIEKQKSSGNGKENPFLLVLAWGPPHAPPPYEKDSPYNQYPDDVKDLYSAEALHVRDNVPEGDVETSKSLMQGYYSHCTALDNAFQRIVDYLKASGTYEETLIVFTSDHGDMLGSQGLWKKQVPFEESLRVPLLMHIPEEYGGDSGIYDDALFEPQDMIPTLLGILGQEKPAYLEGFDYSQYLLNKETIAEDSAVLSIYQPGGQWCRDSDGGIRGFSGREYRGIRTKEYTYVIDKNGPWLMYNNKKDPLQKNNLAYNKEYEEIKSNLHRSLLRKLSERNDDFLFGDTLVREFGYTEEYAEKVNPGEKELCLSNWGIVQEDVHHE